jgi:hypothetical protein
MSDRSTLRTAQTLLSRLENLGGTVPDSMARDLDTLVRLTKEVDRLDLPDGLPSAMLHALADGRDLATDPDVQAAATRRQLTAAIPSARHELATRAHQFLADHADALLDAYREQFDKAAQVLTDSAKTLGAVALDDTAAVIIKGPKAAEAWARAQGAVSTINHTRQAWETLHQALHSSGVDPRFAVLVYADIPPAAWFDDGIAAQHYSERPTPWQCAVAGYPLDLATPATHDQRRAAIYAEGARRDNTRTQSAEHAQGSRFRHTA